MSPVPNTPAPELAAASGVAEKLSWIVNRDVCLAARGSAGDSRAEAATRLANLVVSTTALGYEKSDEALLSRPFDGRRAPATVASSSATVDVSSWDTAKDSSSAKAEPRPWSGCASASSTVTISLCSVVSCYPPVNVRPSRRRTVHARQICGAGDALSGKIRDL